MTIGRVHESPASQSVDWITPRRFVEALGPFDLDPCASSSQPWPCAAKEFRGGEVDGLEESWFGRVWLNPPYGRTCAPWLERLAEHGDGVALIFARTDTRWFFETVWTRADGILFLLGRINFCRPDGRQANNNAGAPSCLVAYGARNAIRLRTSGLEGSFVGSGRLP